jgi:hypothetical protein
MATLIRFAATGAEGRAIAVRVVEDTEAVFGAMTAAGGLPFALTSERQERIYVNPATITYWQPA